jgi:tetratricopeptide (TPR) repeat protein
MAEPAAFRYRAFISYSHADTKWAKWLHRGLESFRIDKDLVGRETRTGSVPQALRPVFRDRDDFTAGHSLTEQTLAALDAAAALVVICSPAAAKSHYVNEEIRLFKSRHPKLPVIPLIVDGRPDDKERECFPDALKFKVGPKGRITKTKVEMLAADAREEGDGKTLALAKVVAGLLGLSADDVFRRAERERRRKGRVRNAIVGVLAFLAVAATGSALYAWQQLKTNEAFLTATLKTATEIVDDAVAQANRYGVPRTATLALLTKAEALFDNMALLGRPTPELRYQKSWMLIQFARNYEALGDTKRWKERAEEAQALLTALVAEDPDDLDRQHALAAARHELGDVLMTEGDLPAALDVYRDGLASAERRVAADPDQIESQLNLSVSSQRVGDVLFAQGDLEGALRAFRDSLAIRKAFAEAVPDNSDWQRDLSVAYEKVGNVLSAQGDLAEALTAYRASLSITERLAATDPTSAAWQRDLSVGYNKVGDMLMAEGNLAEALKVYSDGLAIRQRLAAADPDDAEWQRDLSVAYNKVGDTLVAENNLPKALQSYQAGLVIAASLADADPDNTGRQRDLSVSYMRIGNVLLAQGDSLKALEAYRQSLAVAERLAAADPTNVEWQRDLAVNDWKVATVFAQQNKPAEALDMFRKGHAIIEHLKERFPGNTQLSTDLAEFNAEIAKLEPSDAGSP